MNKAGSTKIEPWIETLIQSYGQPDRIRGVKAYVLQINTLVRCEGQAEGAVALLFLSDGAVQIPAILTRSAWEEMQEMEERENISYLKTCTVFLQRYSLEFQREAEMCKSRFFLTVNKLATVACGAAIDDVPCCSLLPSVRQLICETWRSLQGESSSTTMDTQSGFCLTELLGEWQQECLSSVLMELAKLLASGPHPSSSSMQPSTSRDPPTSALPYTQECTTWDMDRIKDRGQPSFSVPVSHLYIPADQLLAHPERRAENEPQEEQVSASPGANTEAEHEERSPLDSGTDGSSLLGSGQQEEAPKNPWDILASRVGNISTSSLETPPSGSVTPDLLPEKQSPSQPVVTDQDLASDPPACIPLATSTQAFPSGRSCSRELFSSSDHSAKSLPAISQGLEGDAHRLRSPEVSTPHKPTQSSAGSSTPSHLREISPRSDSQTLPPYQKPTLISTSGSSFSSGNSANILQRFSLPPTTQTEFIREDPSVPLSREEEEEEEDEDVLSRRLRRSRKRPLLTEPGEVILVTSADEEERKESKGEDGCSGSVAKSKPPQTSSPPSWLFLTQASGNERRSREAGTESCPAPLTDIRSAIKTHPDGTPFTYCYQPTPPVVKAMSLFKIPDDFVQWSARYLLNAEPSENTS